MGFDESFNFSYGNGCFQCLPYTTMIVKNSQNVKVKRKVLLGS